MVIGDIKSWMPVVVMFTMVIGGWFDSQNTLKNLEASDIRIRNSLKTHIKHVNKTIAAHDAVDIRRESIVTKAIANLQLDQVQQARIEERQKSLQKDGDRREKKLNTIINKLNKLNTLQNRSD